MSTPEPDLDFAFVDQLQQEWTLENGWALAARLHQEGTALEEILSFFPETFPRELVEGAKQFVKAKERSEK